MPKFTNLVPYRTPIWYRHGENSFVSAEYRGKTVDGLHEIELIPDRDDQSGEVIAVPRSRLLLPNVKDEPRRRLARAVRKHGS